MEKENGDGEGAGKPPADGLLDAAGLFGAYWGRDGSANSGAAAQAAAAQAALFGFGSRYPAPSTLGVAANQAASLGLHPAASAAWWSMASHLAAQDYLHRIQASGLNFPHMQDPYSALSALSAGMNVKQPTKPSKSAKSNERPGRTQSSSGSNKDKSPSTNSSSSQPSLGEWGSYTFPKTSSPSAMHSQASMSSLASLNSLVSHHQAKSSAKPSSSQSRKQQSSASQSSSSSKNSMKERDLALLRGDLMLAQAAAQGAYHAAVAAAQKGKNISPLYQFGLGSDKDRHSGIDSLTGLPHNLLSDPSAVLGGVRLPPDTEIIKYTSSLAGPKAPPGTTNRGRKKTISLDPPHVSVHASSDRSTPLPSKRQKMEESPSRSVDVIRMGRERSSSATTPTPPPQNLADYSGISRELLQTIASQSGLSLSALERQLTSAVATDPGMNLSTKSRESPLDLGSKAASMDEDAPLNLSLKPTPHMSQASDALSRLTSLSSSLSASSALDRSSRRKPGAKPRRVIPELNSHIADSPRPKSSGSEDSECWPTREGRPRNLGRGVSKPKKNTVASLLAQSRALGLRPALAQQLLAETDLEKIKALIGETSTDSDCLSDSGRSDSDSSDCPPLVDAHARLPIATGWRRITVIKGLSRNCNIKGEVSYIPPEPHSSVKLKSQQELQAFLEKHPYPALTRDNFSFSSRLILGDYVQYATELAEPITLGEAEITKSGTVKPTFPHKFLIKLKTHRLEEARLLSMSARPTPPPLDRRMELARRQQAARDARRDHRDQAKLVRDLEKSEKVELAKREKEARSQQLLEHINKNRTQLTIEPVPMSRIEPNNKMGEWKMPEISMGPASKSTKDRTIPPISLSLIPVNPKDPTPKTINLNQPNWKEELEQYNALDKMKDFAEKASFDLPKKQKDKYNFDFSIIKTADNKEDSLQKLLESYSRINEFINGCEIEKKDPKDVEKQYLEAKYEFMSQNLMLMPKEKHKSVLPDEKNQDDILTDIISKRNKGVHTYSVGKDGALSISVHPAKELSYGLAKKKRQEDLEKQKMEDQAKRQQERELKRQQAILLKEQQKYITEERERRRQHTSFIRQLDSRKRWEERERRKHQNLLDRLLAKEKKLQLRRKEMELLTELRRPQEDSTLSDQKPLPTLNRIPGLKLPGQAMADVLQVFEFIHNFGQTLGFDMESLPTLNTLQTALLPDCSSEAETELIQVLTQLLVCAIEDPGIPHPGRHTTLLGHAIRMGDITPNNISEVLRIYLYANATGEVKGLTGLTAERERERRVADHHQNDTELLLTCTNAKNTIYYEHLLSNNTYKLAEMLRTKPFLALNSTAKAKMLAFLCNELLQNKSVLRQIDASLDHLNQLKKERYLLDMKIRKLRVLHQRKLRTEHSEKQQALALERMQKLVEESTNSLLGQYDDSALDEESRKTPQPPEIESKEPKDLSHTELDPENSIPEQNLQSPFPKEESDKELSPLKDMPNVLKNKEIMNNNKDECSPTEHKDKDSVMGDEVLSDLESEGTQPEEDEDKNLSSEELARKLEKLIRQSEQQLQQLASGTHALRATCYGQDRYWRRYWSLGKYGGILVEAMESAQPEIIPYHQNLDNAQRNLLENSGKSHKIKKEFTEDQIKDEDDEAKKSADELKSEIELKNIKSELNLSDHTQIIKYEPNMRHGASKVEGSSIKMEEKYIQQKQHNEEQDMLDIEDSIPTAFLVQKPTHKPMFASQAESLDKPQEIVKIENLVQPEITETKIEEESKDELVNNLEELRKMADAVSSQLDAAKKAENEIKEEKIKTPEIKHEIMEPHAATNYLHTKIVEGKWFSILRKENSHLNKITDNNEEVKNLNYLDNEINCSDIIMVQGHKWDVSNNLHLLNDPSLFTLNSMVTCVQMPTYNIYADSSLTTSGLEQSLLDSSVNNINNSNSEDFNKSDVNEEMVEDNDLEKELQADALKAELNKSKSNNLQSLGLLNFNALSTYVTCDSPPPLQMTPEEVEQLEYCKQHGLPKKLEGNFVPKELRYGWWRITDPDQLQQVMDALHPRGVRERELFSSLTQHVPVINNKLYIEKGDIHSTELSISHLDRVIAQNGGYPSPDSIDSYSIKTAQRIDDAVLEMIEQLEERVSAGSMQVKGWRPGGDPGGDQREGSPTLHRARDKLAALEAHIERRYLKPPLVHTTTEAQIGAVLQGEAHLNSAPSPQNSDGNTENKESRGPSRGLAVWREAVSRCVTAAQLAMAAHALEAAIAWDKSIMKANCQFCLCGDNEDQLLLCDGCDKGYHTYCFKPRMDKIPEGDWYCWECVNKARGERVCIVCGGLGARGRTIPCALCARAYHQHCHYPPLHKNPRGKWYCSHCISKAPPKKPRNFKKKEHKNRDMNSSMDVDTQMVPSPSLSQASSSSPEAPPEVMLDPTNGTLVPVTAADLQEPVSPPPEYPPEEEDKTQMQYGNGTLNHYPTDCQDIINTDTENQPVVPKPKKDKNAAKKLIKELQMCKNLLLEMECHEHAWPFLVPVNTKQFPQYKKIIKVPMDLSTIKRRLQDSSYKSKEDFATDVRLMFSNCEVFNEDDSPVGRAGHNMRQFFELKWSLI